MLFRVVLSLLLLQSQGLALQNKVWLRGHDASKEDFYVFLKNSNRLSYAEFQLERLRGRADKFQLKEKLIVAQKLYLDGKRAKAMKFFNQITKEAYSAEWSAEDRRMILYAFLRSAQIQEEEEKARAFLILAGSFHGKALLLESYPDLKLFPPPLIKRLQKIQEKSSFLSPDWELIFPGHEIILINGERIAKDQKRSFLPGTYRVTALSSSHRAWSKKIHLSRLLLKPIQTEKLTLGFCDQIELIPQLQKQKRLKVFPASKCRPVEDLVWGGETLQKDSGEGGMNPDLDLSRRLYLERERGGEVDEEEKKSNLPAWFLAGVGIIAFSLLIFFGGKKESSEDYVY